MSNVPLRQARKYMAHPATPPPQVTPPTRIVVSGGPKAEPHLSQAPLDQTPGISRGALVWVVGSWIVGIVVAILILINL